MNVETILRGKGQHVEVISPAATVWEAIDCLTSKGIGALVVTEDGDYISGLVSERDLVRGLARHGERALSMPVTAVMSPPVPVCAPDDTVREVMELMTMSRHRHLPVVQDGRLSGIVSIGDVVKSRLEEVSMETAILRDAYPYFASARADSLSH
jgi:CBS domain-containing protein